MILSRVAAVFGILLSVNYAWVLLAILNVLPWPPETYAQASLFGTMPVVVLLTIVAFKYGNRDREQEKFLNTRAIVYGRLHKVAASLLAEAEATKDTTRRDALLTQVIAIWDANARTNWPEVGFCWPSGAHDLSPQLVREIVRVADVMANAFYWRKEIAEKYRLLCWAESSKTEKPAD
ncbi:MAG: hypothetical protein WC641_07435 [Patescibacteria group bacterium]